MKHNFYKQKQPIRNWARYQHRMMCLKLRLLSIRARRPVPPLTRLRRSQGHVNEDCPFRKHIHANKDSLLYKYIMKLLKTHPGH